MKKASIILLVIFLMAVSFLGGLFIGKSTNRSDVRITQQQTTTMTSTTGTTGSVDTTEPSTPSDSEPGLININTATALELATLPNIGDVIAQRIVDYRTKHGPFQSLGELTEVEGIGQKRLEGIMDYITIGG